MTDKFTDKQLRGASILMAAHAMEGLPENFREYLSSVQQDDLMGEIRKGVEEVLEGLVWRNMEDGRK